MRSDARAQVEALVGELAAAGANLTLELPDGSVQAVGRHPGAARVRLRAASLLERLRRRDLLRLAEAYLSGEIDLEGDVLEVVKLTDVIAPDPGWRERLAFGLRLWLRSRRALQRESVAFHYDRPPEFFLPWFERWRSYSHGLYLTPNDDPSAAQARKLQAALDALGAKPGDRVFDMGCGWGSFLEYAGLQGVQVHGITISREQHRFVSDLIRERRLPCSVQLSDFLDVRPDARFDGAVFMGTFEHFGDYRFAARFLARWLAPEARVWADFCTARGSRLGGAFLKKHVWPGSTSYVDVPKLVAALDAEGFNLHQLQDDTRSYALTVRDWADAFDRETPALEARFGHEPVRAFRLFLRASQYFLSTNKTQAYHLVAGRQPAGLPRPSGAAP
jgi:cyclopropane-fatty-acyl-phospholipid synthase